MCNVNQNNVVVDLHKIIDCVEQKNALQVFDCRFIFNIDKAEYKVDVFLDASPFLFYFYFFCNVQSLIMVPKPSNSEYSNKQAVANVRLIVLGDIFQHNIFKGKAWDV